MLDWFSQRRWTTVAALYFIVCMSLSLIPFKMTSADDRVNQVRIGTDPASGFIQVENMVPGDTVTSFMDVQNDGEADFHYTISARLMGGADDLFEQLQLMIADRSGAVYEGALHSLNKISLGMLATQADERLTFRVSLPKEAGNVLQGKHAAVAFDFLARSDLEQPAPDRPSADGDGHHHSSNGTLPQTASSWYTVLLIGFVLTAISGLIAWRSRKIE